MGNNDVTGMTTVSGGGLLRDANAPSARCISCGAFGEVPLCPKHYEELMKSLDYYAKGAFKKLIDSHMAIVKTEENKSALERKKQELADKVAEIEQLQKELGELDGSK